MPALSRRSLIATASALPALAVPAVAGDAMATPKTADAAVLDDTLDRITEHRQCQSRLDDICDRMGNLEEELPAERRKAFMINDRGSDVGKDNDPRWTTVQAEYWSAEDRLDGIAWSFVDRPPTTVGGVAAVLSYAAEYEEEGYEWPDARIRFTESGRYIRHDEEDWRRSLDKAIATQFAGTVAMVGTATLGPPSVPSTESRLLELERQAAAAEAAAVKAGKVHSKAEKLMIAWEQRNPRPNEDAVNDPGRWKYGKAVKRWEARRSIARTNCRYDELETSYEGLIARADAIRDEAAAIPANTINGLRCKARMLSEADLLAVGDSGLLAGSIVDELRAATKYHAAHEEAMS